MRRLWLLFAQAVTVCIAVLFVVTTLRPDWLGVKPQLRNPNGAVGLLPSTDSNASQAPGSYAGAVSVAAPAVVNIHTTKRATVSRLPLPPDPVLRKFFEQMPGFNQTQQTTSLGSGVVVSAKGHVLTNLHVIEGADEIVVALTDGRQAVAKVLGVDADSDLAVLQVEMSQLPVLGFASLDPPKIGDVVLAIGNPFGVGQTITMGIVSALGREGLGINTYENFIQTDAAINPGNSGGALVDTLGRLVGINTAIYSRSGGSLGIGFAIPAVAAQKVLSEIVTFGFVKRGWLGIEPQDMTADLARAFGLERVRGVIIAGIMRDGPGAKGGLKVGDIVQTIAGQPVNDTQRLMARIAANAPGETIELGIYRNGRTQTLTMTLGQRPVKPK
ncbi:MAG: trypsin-like peptidase domain-containing protein [Candidatus Methylopumilus sp.]|nr:trypsin-like peptidase domain-containing protein [Candidatus Methylopumilus sp.]